MYVEAPNEVEFSGSATIQAVIVADPAEGTSVATNTIQFTGNVTAMGVESLPEDPEFAGLHEKSGSFILAEGFGLDFSGNFGTVNGMIVGSQFDFSGNAEGIISGTVINMDDSEFVLGGTTNVTIQSQSTTDEVPGLVFGENFLPDPDTYTEL